MKGQIDLEVKGLDALLKQLKELPNVAQNKAARKGLRAAAKKFYPVAKGLVPVRTGQLKAAIKVRAGKKRRNRITMYVGPALGFMKGKTFYAGFVEWGTANMGEHKFIEPAFDREAETAGNEAIATIWEEIAKAIGGK